jgi:hypothetical protein
MRNYESHYRHFTAIAKNATKLKPHLFSAKPPELSFAILGEIRIIRRVIVRPAPLERRWRNSLVDANCAASKLRSSYLDILSLQVTRLFCYSPLR